MEDSETALDPEGGTEPVTRASYDWEVTSPAAAVVETVGKAFNAAHTTFEPLYDTVDPDALNALVMSSDAPGNPNATVSFEYADRLVIVHSSGDVDVQETI